MLDDEGLVHPFPRALGMRDANGGTYRVAPESLGAVGVTPLPVSMVVAARHVAGARWTPSTMSPGETVLALFDNTLAAQARPGDALTTLSKTVRDASALRGTRGDASQVVEHILAQQVVPLP